MDGSRTHRSSQRDPPPVLKTGEPTGTQPLPKLSILHGIGFVNDDGKSACGKVLCFLKQVRICMECRRSTLRSTILADLFLSPPEELMDRRLAPIRRVFLIGLVRPLS